jgi:hypothetical protein
VSLGPVLALEAQLPTRGIPRAPSLACKSVGSTLSAGHPGHCEREDHQTLALFYSALDSSLFSNGTGHPSGGPWRQFQCTSCEGYFLKTHGTIFHGKRVAGELIVHVLACLAEGLGIRATARVFEVDPNTVLQWLVEAAEPLRAFSASFLYDVHVKQLQLDELYAVLRGVKAGEISEENAIKRLERARHWVWTAIDPESKLLLAIDIGPRTLAMAQRVVHQVVQKLVPSCVPLCLTDGYRDYTMAVLSHFGF